MEVGSQKELGIPYMQHYDPRDYNGRPDNQALVQADNGLMYIGNSNGVLEFDGVNWRLIKLPNNSLIRTLMKTESGRIFVGGFNELGYLEPDSLGFTGYRSIKSSLDSIYQNFNYLHNSFSVGKQIYFQSKDFLFRWENETFKIWSPKHGILHSFLVNETIYLQQKDKGLYRLKGEQLSLVTNFDYEIRGILPYEEEKLLVATKEHGLFFLESNKIQPFPVPMEKYLQENIIVQCRLMPNGWITIGTGMGGLVVLDQDGSLVHLLDKTSGLLNNGILAQALDHQGGLWLGLNHGISRVELLSPYSIFDERLGVTGFVNAITRYNGKLFAASIDGLLQLQTAENGSPKQFVKTPEVGPSFYMSEIDQHLYIASRTGTVRYNGEEVEQISEMRSGALLRSKKDPSILYLGLFDGLAILRKQHDTWEEIGKIPGIEDDIRELVEMDDGKLWMESQIDGVWRVDFYQKDTFNINRPEVKHFVANKELPPGWLFLHSLRGEAVFGIGGTVYTYDSNLDSIIPYRSFGDPFGFKGDIVPKLEDEDGNLWMSGQFTDSKDEKKQRTVSRLQKDGTYKVESVDDRRIEPAPKKALFPEKSGILWYGGPTGIVRQDLKQTVKPIADMRTLIRKISINMDSVVYGGEKKTTTLSSLTFENNTLRFEYALPSFDEVPKNKYSYYLEGYDQDWSDWTKETKKDYTQIPEGSYTFRVKGQNIYEQISNQDNYAFTILPPWYRSWWAYLGYAIIFGGFFLLVLQWRAGQLKKKNLALEKLVEERTQIVRNQSLKLKEQAHGLLELDRAKSRFFSNISHEFRTPLTLIKGPVERLEQNPGLGLNMDTIKMIRRNTNRLLRLVNQLLDLSKIDEGSLKLELTEGDVFKCIRAATSSFNSHAAQRNIDYRIEIPTNSLWASFDRGKLENVIYNLLGNAFKFSEDSTEITFKASYDQNGLQVSVADTGPGISEEKLPLIFDRFYQADSEFTREKEGTGIGLSLSKDLVELMGGKITVFSELGKGTLFVVMLPLLEIRTGNKTSDLTTTSDKNLSGAKPYRFQKADKRDVPTILLIEDNADMRGFIKDQLIEFYKVKEALDGEKGLQKALADNPDLIITDLMMPKMDGITLCKKLKSDVHTSHIPVIMLTAKAGMENKIEGLETGADDYLTKPFNANELLVRAKNLIVQRQQLRALFSKSETKVDPKRITVTTIDEKFLEELLLLLEEKYADSAFGVPEMQNALAMSKTQLHRKLKALTNEAPGELLRNFRLKRAAQLLSQKADSVTQIAYSVGFNNLSYFAKCFRELYGTSPSSYQSKK